MPIIAKGGSDGPRILPPAGIHQAVCVYVEDLGEEYSEKFDKVDRKVIIGFEINERIPASWLDEAGKEHTVPEDRVGKRFMVSTTYTLSLGKKANLRRDLEGWRGRPFTQEELEGFDVEVLNGVNCMLNLVHYTTDAGQRRCKIAAVTPPMKGLPKMNPELDKLPEFIAERREANLKAMQARATQRGAQAKPPAGHDEPPMEGMDEVPF